MSDLLIYVDRLRAGQTQPIDASFPPSVLEVDETELQFSEPVVVRGEAYITDEHLVIRLKASTKGKMPCAICNEMTAFPLEIRNFYHTEPLEEIKEAIYDAREILREALLGEIPKTIECKGKCPQREQLGPYLRPQTKQDITTHFPFADL